MARKDTVDEQYVDDAQRDALEAQVPWERVDFRTGLAVLTAAVAVAAKAFADEARTLSTLAAMVPRAAGAERRGRRSARRSRSPGRCRTRPQPPTSAGRCA